MSQFSRLVIISDVSVSSFSVGCDCEILNSSVPSSSNWENGSFSFGTGKMITVFTREFVTGEFTTGVHSQDLSRYFLTNIFHPTSLRNSENEIDFCTANNFLPLKRKAKVARTYRQIFTSKIKYSNVIILRVVNESYIGYFYSLFQNAPMWAKEEIPSIRKYNLYLLYEGQGSGG